MAKWTEEQKAARREARMQRMIEEAHKRVKITTYIKGENGEEIWLSKKVDGVWYDNPEVPTERRRAQATKIAQVCADVQLAPYGLRTVVDDVNGV